MKYLFDIGHPAEFHYFKLVIRNLEKKGHQVLITARDKDVNLELLKKSGLEFICTGRNIPSRLGKMFTLFRNDYHIYKAIKKFKPDLIINFFSPFAAQAGWLTGIPVLGFHDTEIAGISIKLAQPFTDMVVVPECYTRRLPEKKLIRFKGYFELCHLHPNHFIPDPSIRDILGIDKNEKFILLRFVSHRAIHDTGFRGMSLEMKRKAVKGFLKFGRVFISSEEPLPEDLTDYELNVPVEKIHDVLYYASLCYGESATMSAESAMLGTPAVFLDEKGRGYTHDMEKEYGLVFNYSMSKEDQESSIAKGIELLKNPDHQHWQKKQEELLGDHIDVTAFMSWLIEQYPESVEIMRKNPKYQFKFE
jgi:predicted glycosyltransferase